MKKVFVILLSLGLINSALSQDIITKTNGEDIKSQVLEVGNEEIRYKKFEQPNGPVYVISKSEILMIRYQDGSKDIMKAGPKINEPQKKEVVYTGNEDFARMGKEDAIKNYTGKNSGSGWTTATVILASPLIGLIPAAICASTPPSESNLNIKNTELMKNAEYENAYKEQAHKIKKKKVWTGFGVGAAVWGIIILISNSGE